MTGDDAESVGGVWRPGEEIPDGAGVSGVGHWKSDGPNECTACGIEFDAGGDPSSGPLREHIDEEHPRSCSNYGCSQIAAYRRGAGFSTGSVCAECLYKNDHPAPLSSWHYLTNEANREAPLLPEDHPVEQALRGLYGGRDGEREATA